APDRAAGAAEGTGAVLPVLQLLEQRQHGGVVPAGVAGLRPAVVVGPVATGPDHAVDAARPAQDLAQRQGKGAASDVRARLVTIGPVVLRAEVLNPLRRGSKGGAPPPSPPLPPKGRGLGARPPPHAGRAHHPT